MMRALLCLSLIACLAAAHPAAAQALLGWSEVQVSYVFGAQVVFAARFDPAAPVAQVEVLVRPRGQENTRTIPASLPSPGSVAAQAPADSLSIPPYAVVDYSLRATLATGEVVSSEVYSFRYDDNRFAWLTLEDRGLRVHWYGGDAEYGQSAFDAAQAGLLRLGSLLPGQSGGEAIEVYVYSSAADWQSAWNDSAVLWAAGHASPQGGVAMVSVMPGPEQQMEFERQIPHELGHILLYRSTGSAYDRLPVWLREGFSTQAELYANPDYARALVLAGEQQQLIPMTELCAAFPADAGRIFLAYAQSDALVRFIVDNYGASGLGALIRAYADGLDCEQGARQALGLGLSELEARWRGMPPGGSTLPAWLSALAPYLFLLVLVLLVPLGLILSEVLKRRK